MKGERKRWREPGPRRAGHGIDGVDASGWMDGSVGWGLHQYKDTTLLISHLTSAEAKSLSAEGWLKGALRPPARPESEMLIVRINT